MDLEDWACRRGFKKAIFLTAYGPGTGAGDTNYHAAFLSGYLILLRNVFIWQRLQGLACVAADTMLSAD